MAVFERPIIALTLNTKRLLKWLVPVNTRRRTAVEYVLKSLSPIYRVAYAVKVLSFGPLSLRQHLVLSRTPTAVPSDSEPHLTILIPVHGKWSVTRRCLASISLHHDNRHAIEVLLVDDSSPDNTAERAKKISGLRVLRLEENVGFTKAVNRGLREAHGRHVVLLNNDTVVMPGWIDPLLEWADCDDVGIVGVTLLFPDGRIQEAGGAIFSDASAANLRRGERWKKTDSTEAKDVDYCSGAALLVTRQLLDHILGFDERYSPAYYEDTDLAMTAREHGLRVIYEPRSLVIHFEGVTHGRDLTSGSKTYQVRNRVFFYDKWQSRLAKFRGPYPEASLRGPGLPSGRLVIVFDETIPTPDRDSGSVRMMHLLRSLTVLGYQPVLIPRNRLSFREYLPHLTSAGVHVWMEGFEPWANINERLGDVFCFIITRPTVGETYVIPLTHRYPEVPIIYDTVDLHFLRWEREVELDPATHSQNEVESMRRLELTLARHAGATLVVSPVERDLIVEHYGLTSVFVVPNAHDIFAAPTLENRSGLIFVGNFQHPPNVDAMVWFLDEVLPLVKYQLPEITVTVVGDRAPRSLTKRGSPSVRFVGWVRDTTSFYNQARIAIAPLRFGAGMKGKVGDAMARGVPTVLTSIAAEGIDITPEENALIANSAEEFSNAIIRLCCDDALWNSVRRDAINTVRTTLGVTQLRHQLQAALEAVSAPTKS
jgi:GT2 family glycosyltransferase/glycosyltransferase involved in cell wall biosynthesis